MVYLVPYQDGTRDAPARAPCSHLGRTSPRGRSQAGRGTPDAAAPPSRAARSSVPGPRHAACAKRPAVAPERVGVSGDIARLSRVLARSFPSASLQRSIRSSPLGSRGGRNEEVRSRRSGARHPRGPCDQPCPAAGRPRMGWALSFARVAHPARGPKRIGVCAAELSEAPPWCFRNRPTLVCSLVSRMAENRRGAVGGRARGRRAYVAGAKWVEATRPSRSEGSAPKPLNAAREGLR